MIDEKKRLLFEEIPVQRAVLTLSLPTVISSLVMVIYNLSDTYFVGMLNNPIQNAAVTLAGPALLLFNAVNNLFGVGSSSMMSRALGIKDYGTVYRSSAFGFYCSIFCGVLFSLVYVLFKNPIMGILGADAQTIAATAEYLKWTVAFGAAPSILNVVMSYLVRSEGATLHASIGTMSGCLLNIILDPVFILPQGLNMGAAGAGCATFVANCAACVYFFVLLFLKRGKTCVCIRPSMMVPNKKIVFGVLGVGIPAAIQNMLNVTGMTVLNNFTSSYGPQAVAAMGIVHKVVMVPVCIAMGMGQGIMPLVSYTYSANNIPRMKKTVVFSMKISTVFLFAVLACYYIFAGSLVSMFMKDVQIVAYGTKFLRAGCLALPFLSADFLAVGVFQACGMGGKSLAFAILRKIILEIPALYILNAVYPLYGLAYAQPMAEFVLSVAAVVVLAKIFEKAGCR